MSQKHGLSFPSLLDPGNQVADAFGLRHVFPEDLRTVFTTFGLELPRFNGDDSWSLPMPARYIIDGEGVVRHRWVSADYTVRPDIEETLEVLG